MNKEEIKKRIENMKQEISELEKELEKKPVRGRVKLGETYYFINSNGHVCQGMEENHKYDNYRHSKGNYFKTEVELWRHERKLIFTQRYKDFVSEYNDGWKPDFVGGYYNFYLYFNYTLNKISTGSEVNSQTLDAKMYFKNEGFLEYLSERMTDEEIKIVLGVE